MTKVSGVRLVSLTYGCAQNLGQAAYVADLVRA